MTCFLLLSALIFMNSLVFITIFITLILRVWGCACVGVHPLHSAHSLKVRGYLQELVPSLTLWVLWTYLRLSVLGIGPLPAEPFADNYLETFGSSLLSTGQE